MDWKRGDTEEKEKGQRGSLAQWPRGKSRANRPDAGGRPGGAAAEAADGALLV